MKVKINKLNTHEALQFRRAISQLEEKNINFDKHINIKFSNYYKSLFIRNAIKKKKDYTFIVGKRQWYKDSFHIKRGVFVPQPDTEGILDFFNNKKETGLEIGVGVGVISLSLSKYFNKIMFGIDVNRNALRLTKKNANKMDTNIKTSKVNVFIFKSSQKFDFIVSNPPYVLHGEKIEDWVKENQPSNAVFVKKKICEFYERIIFLSNEILKPRGYIVFEISEKVKENIEPLLKEKELKYNFYKDINDQWRYLIVKKDKKL